ncbi:MAG TPA: tetratricopeptide repeat protein [Kofleriaceae bacterium]|nr:tetratricopeptide repeat protein [Kofleriaceae bacterium]
MLGLVIAFASPGSAFADARSDARAHYQQGVKLYNGGNYREAIKEFSAAQQIAPADLNNYNLALCYDKLGDPEPAIQYYRAYLDKVPNTDKRAEIEASITRLEAAAKSVAAKRDAEAKKADEAKKPAVGPAAPTGPEPLIGPTKPDDTTPPAGPTRGRGGVGSTGVPSSGAAATTGDAQLDRAQQLDVNQIRDQRMGGASSGMPDTRGGPATVGAGPTDPNAPPTANPNPNPNTPPQAANGAAPATAPTDPADKPKATPVYKKWWFWAVVAVSAYVVYSIATEDSRSSSTARTLDPKMFSIGGQASPQPGGLTLMRW